MRQIIHPEHNLSQHRNHNQEGLKREKRQDDLLLLGNKKIKITFNVMYCSCQG